MNVSPGKKPFYSMLGLAIFCTILSFIAFPGIIYASKANTAYALGKELEARRLNRIASYWCVASGIWLLLVLLMANFAPMQASCSSKTETKATVLKELFAGLKGQVI